MCIRLDSQAKDHVCVLSRENSNLNIEQGLDVGYQGILQEVMVYVARCHVIR